MSEPDLIAVDPARLNGVVRVSAHSGIGLINGQQACGRINAINMEIDKVAVSILVKEPLRHRPEEVDGIYCTFTDKHWPGHHVDAYTCGWRTEATVSGCNIKAVWALE